MPPFHSRRRYYQRLLKRSFGPNYHSIGHGEGWDEEESKQQIWLMGIKNHDEESVLYQWPGNIANGNNYDSLKKKKKKKKMKKKKKVEEEEEEPMKKNAPFAGNARSTQRISSTTFREILHLNVEAVYIWKYHNTSILKQVLNYGGFSPKKSLPGICLNVTLNNTYFLTFLLSPPPPQQQQQQPPPPPPLPIVSH
ncbi:hypothetical protein M0802_010195 [Mischocyttarus mexicanus]|nr:hypothetical protein M0802_010195 [Mischocyttarus mexicanus]